MLEFDWDQGNLEHIARHDVTATEVKYVLKHATLDYGYQDGFEEERFEQAARERAECLWSLQLGVA